MKKIIFTACLLGALFTTNAQTTIPYEVVNNSPDFADDEIFICLVGETDNGPVWIDFRNNAENAPALMPINESFNTINVSEGDWAYADIFTPLSEISNNTLNIPEVHGCRLFISFANPMYIHFFESGGYAGPNLQNPTDPNINIRHEIIELTWSPNGLWTNTTRVDAYQYPMGLEVWGTASSNNQYQKAGELLPHQAILELFHQSFPSENDFFPCYKDHEFLGPANLQGIIEQPSKLEEFKPGGVSELYFQAYIDAIWEHFKTNEFAVNIPNWGVFRGYVEQGTNILKMTNSDNVQAWINGKPNTQEVIEGKGVLAEDVAATPHLDADKVFQAQFSAAVNRGVVDHTLASGALQGWDNEAAYFNSNFTFNKYVWFFHQENITYDSKTYAFAYDDVFDQSSTLQTSIPESVRITIGGFYDYSLSVAETSSTNGLTVIYPNPTKDTVMLAIKNLDISGVHYALYDSYGRKVSGGNVTQENTTVSMKNLSSGTYILKVNKDDLEIKNIKILKN